MIVFRVTGGHFLLNPEPPLAKKPFHLEKAFRRNQTFVIQIAISVALPLSCEVFDGYI